jgi:hypothetical protein
LGVKPNERYPQDRLKEIEELLVKRAADAEAARLAAEDQQRLQDEGRAIDARYNDVIAQADEAMAGKNYMGARGSFTPRRSTSSRRRSTPRPRSSRSTSCWPRRSAGAAKPPWRPTPRRMSPSGAARRTAMSPSREEQAERFMREAREREEAEKYERIQKLKHDVSETERNNSDKASDRRMNSMEQGAQMIEAGAGLYQGSERNRMAYADSIAALKETLAAEERGRQVRAQNQRASAYSDKLTTEQQFSETQAGWNERYAQNADRAVQDKEAITNSSAADRQFRRDRSSEARAQAEMSAENMARMQERGNQMASDNHERVLEDKHAQENREAELSHRSEDRRLNEQERLARTPHQCAQGLRRLQPEHARAAVSRRRHRGELHRGQQGDHQADRGAGQQGGRVQQGHRQVRDQLFQERPGDQRADLDHPRPKER